jgi:hypothetical protein
MSAAPTITVIPHPRGGWTHGVSVPGTSRTIYVGQWDNRSKAEKFVADHKKALSRLVPKA